MVMPVTMLNSSTIAHIWPSHKARRVKVEVPFFTTACLKSGMNIEKTTNA